MGMGKYLLDHVASSGSLPRFGHLTQTPSGLRDTDLILFGVLRSQALKWSSSLSRLSVSWDFF